MNDRIGELQNLLAEVRRRWTRRARLQAWALGAGAAAVVLLVGLLAIWMVAGEGLPLVVVAAAVLPLAVYCLAAALAPLRHPPGDAQLARFIEERAGGLDDVLVTAVEKSTVQGPQSAVQGSPPTVDRVTGAIVADAVRAARSIPVDRVISREAMTRALGAAAVASVALVASGGVFAPSAGRAGHVVGAYLFPTRYTIEVRPGSAKALAGKPLSINARIPGIEGGLVPTLTVGEGLAARSTRMQAGAVPGEFSITFDELKESFSYFVSAGAARSPGYTITAIRPVRVSRIDLRFEFPKAFGLAPRVEPDSGDILAPAGTKVQVTVTADKPVVHGQLTLAEGPPLPLQGSDRVLTADLTVAAEGSYRVALVDDDGLSTPGDTEYFIRMIDDRPPDVRILRPAGDKQVSPLEEVAIEARADDDYGVESLELVVRASNGKEAVIPIGGALPALSATGRHTVFLEDLKVQPGDFVTYHARARDAGRGRRGAEARSDIFFLEVKPYEEEFVAAESQAMGGQAPDAGVEELAAAEKDIIAATWKLDERARKARNARSAKDIKAVADAQLSLKTKAEEAAGRISRTMGDPRRRRGPDAGAMPVRDNPMSRAVGAMGRAADELDRLQTSTALPNEMEALNQLLKAAAEIRRRQVSRQQAQGGGGSNRQAPDMSTLFDQELRKKLQSNYETPTTSDSRAAESKTEDPLDKIRELARRQDALAREQRELAKNRDRLAEDELKRQLERLTRDQNELRQQAEQLSQQLQQSAAAERTEQSSQASTSRSGSSSSGQTGKGASGDAADPRKLREISEEMRRAAADLTRQNPQQASERGGKALQQLRDLEQRIQSTRPDDRRRALGDLQLEARQMADAERQLGHEAARAGAAGAGDDARRRLAAEQERLADRADRLGQSVRQLSKAGGDAGSGEQQATDAAARELERQNVAEKMRQSAQAMRSGSSKDGQAGSTAEDVARSLDKVAERLGAATGARDSETQQLSEQIARTQELRDRLASVQRSMDALARAGDESPKGQASQPDARGQSPQGQTPQGQATPQPSAGAQPGSTGQEGGAGEQGGAPAGRAGEVARLRRQVDDQMRDAERLAREVQRMNPGLQNGSTTPEEWSRSVSAPGTEAFKQDFSKWASLKKNLLVALERTETQLSDRLRSRENKERLNAGRRQAAPESYRELVDRYYQSLATPRRPSP